MHQVISEQTAGKLRVALEKVVAQGTGKQAYMPGYRLAGKDRYIKQVIDGRTSGRYLAWFIALLRQRPENRSLGHSCEPREPITEGDHAAPCFLES